MRLVEIGGDWWRLDEGDERIQAYTVGTSKGTGRPREERGVPWLIRADCRRHTCRRATAAGALARLSFSASGIPDRKRYRPRYGWNVVRPLICPAAPPPV
jgi:hypothetical protein